MTRVPVIEIKQGDTVFLRIGADEIWLKPGCNADAVARHFLAALHNQLHAVIEYEVAKRLKELQDGQK